MMRGATQARIELMDAVGGLSAAMTVPLRVVEEVGLGATCDDMHAVLLPLVCGSSTTCEAPPEVAGACAGAAAIAAPAPTTVTTPAMVTGAFAGGAGVFTGSCGPTTESELIYTVSVPAGGVDLLATTNLPGTGATDTVLYARGTCADPLTELGCADDVSRDVLSSEIELRDLAAGTYTIFVERYAGTTGADFALQVSLRPVLATGATCDPAGVMNRCAAGACVSATMTCP